MSFADVVEIKAALAEGFDLREDCAFVELPGLSAFFDLFADVFEDVLPAFTALVAFLQVLNALHDVTMQHVVYINNINTAIYYLIRNFPQEPSYSLSCVVELGVLPYLPYLVQNFRQDSRDLVRLGFA